MPGAPLPSDRPVPAHTGSSVVGRLDDALLDAHAREDRETLVALYAEAGDHELAAGNVDAGCFFLTHAYVYALEAGHPDADRLHAVLKRHGRDC
ncbi:MAG: hypothetical protein AAGL24_12545 [Pseudomonadota bacterium]